MSRAAPTGAPRPAAGTVVTAAEDASIDQVDEVDAELPLVDAVEAEDDGGLAA